MELLLFGVGCAVGAVLAWFVGRREPSRPAVLALSGAACGLLGILTSARWDTRAPAIEFGLGLVGTAGPLTLCMLPWRTVVSRMEIASAGRDLAGALALALVWGISCATVGVVSVQSVRQVLLEVGEPGVAVPPSSVYLGESAGDCRSSELGIAVGPSKDCAADGRSALSITSSNGVTP